MLSTQRCHTRLEAIRCGQDIPRPVCDGSTFSGELGTTCRAAYQGELYMPFQTSQTFSHRRLSKVQSTSSRSDTAVFGNSKQGFQGAKISSRHSGHRHSLCINSQFTATGIIHIR